MELGWKVRHFGENLGYVLKQIPALAGCAVGYVGKASPEKVTERIVLRRPLTEAERRYFREAVEQFGQSEWSLPLSFFRFPRRWESKVLKKQTLSRLHNARIKLVTEWLPNGEKILDLGGAVDKHPEGALLAMGYPHKPKSITIVDLPDEERLHRPGQEKLRDHLTEGGTNIHYVYSRMDDLSAFANGSFDLVWSGQSIEHITEAQAESVLREVKRVLVPGGRFCLDTPNGRMMRLISREMMHPEHKIEYRPEQFVAKLLAAGFEIEALKAVTPLPISARLGRISKLEILREARVGDDSSVGLSFYVAAKKPPCH